MQNFFIPNVKLYEKCINCFAAWILTNMRLYIYNGSCTIVCLTLIVVIYTYSILFHKIRWACRTIIQEWMGYFWSAVSEILRRFLKVEALRWNSIGGQSPMRRKFQKVTNAKNFKVDKTKVKLLTQQSSIDTYVTHLILILSSSRLISSSDSFWNDDHEWEHPNRIVKWQKGDASKKTLDLHLSEDWQGF